MGFNNKDYISNIDLVLWISAYKNLETNEDADESKDEIFEILETKTEVNVTPYYELSLAGLFSEGLKLAPAPQDKTKQKFVEIIEVAFYTLFISVFKSWLRICFANRNRILI